MGELDEEEPEVLPTMIPLCFLPKYETVSIAFGLRTEIPTYDLKDLKKRLLYLIKQGKKVVISPKMVGCKVLSTDNELESFLKGELKVIKGTGIYEIDELNKRVYIKGWNPRQTFPTLLKKIDSYKGWNILGSVSYIDESNDEDHTCIRLEVCRGRNINEYFDKLKESVIECLKFENNYNIACVDRSGEIVQPSIDVMLLNTYMFYKEIVKIHLTDNIKQLNDKIVELDIISRIRPHLSVVSIKNKPEDDLISELSKLSNISDIGLLKKIMDKFKIRKLLSISTDITSIKNEITTLTNNLNNIDDFVVNQYKEL
jgi:DNA gyrase/topoisomerase IV subunit A